RSAAGAAGRARRRRGGPAHDDAGGDRLADDGREGGGVTAWLRNLLVPLLAVLAAFAVGAVLILAVGDSPLLTYELLLRSALTWPDGIGSTLFYATPLIFTGLAVAVAFRCGLLNIGAEGQLYVASFVCAWVGIVCAGLPGVVLVPLCMLAAVVAGGVWGGIP